MGSRVNIGDVFYRSRLGRGHVSGRGGEVTFLRKVPEHAHKGKMVDR